MTILENSSFACRQKYEDFYVNKTDELYCNATWDDFLCWPPTLAGTNATQRCPSGNSFETTKSTYRTCGLDGRWEGKEGKPNGYTHIETCVYDVLYKLLKALQKDGNLDAKLAIAENTRTLEFVGLTISLISLLMSLFIFCHYRSLRNNRTRVHIHLFVAMLIQVIMRLIVYIDQAIIKQGFLSNGHGIDNTAWLCEGAYLMLEYARTAMFMWMFVEGLYLHNMLTLTVFKENAYHWCYYFVGWGLPACIAFIWAAIMFAHYKKDCWIGYNLTAYYWILEGPRLLVLLLNTLFLFNIIRILIVKLKQTHTSELEQIKTAVRATLFLIPLMGITNLLIMTDSHIEGKVWEFALWSYTTHFMSSFQGFFIALLYCFLNGEVRSVVKQSIMNQMQLRHRHSPVGLEIRRRSVSGITGETEA